MAAKKLTKEQRRQFTKWLAADYSSSLILQWMQEQRTREVDPVPWPELTRAMFTYYRNQLAPEIAELRAARHTAALNTGLALKEERVQRLKEHADALEAIKWDPAENGRLWNEKAWRETLDDIARELGHRRQSIDLTLEQELKDFLDALRDTLDPETYARIVALAAGSRATEG